MYSHFGKKIDEHGSISHGILPWKRCSCPLLIWRRFKKFLYLDPHPNTGLNQNTQLTTEFAAAQQ